MTLPVIMLMRNVHTLATEEKEADHSVELYLKDASA